MFANIHVELKKSRVSAVRLKILAQSIYTAEITLNDVRSIDPKHPSLPVTAAVVYYCRPTSTSIAAFVFNSEEDFEIIITGDNTDDLIVIVDSIRRRILKGERQYGSVNTKTVISSERFNENIIVGVPNQWIDRLKNVTDDIIFWLAALVIFLVSPLIWPDYSDDALAGFSTMSIVLALKILINSIRANNKLIIWRVKE